jgi:hypothetical protein
VINLSLLRSLLCLRAIFTLVIAALPLVTYGFEPLNTDDAGTVGKGVRQIEQYFYVLNNNSPGDPGDIAAAGEEFRGLGNAKALPFTFTYGLSDSTELSFGTTYYMSPRGDYSPFANNAIALKWRLIGDGDEGLSIAVKPTITLPASTSQQTKGLGLARTNYEFNFIASYFWDSFEIHANISYARNPYNSSYPISGAMATPQVNVVSGSIAPVWTVNSWLKLAIDIGSYIDTTPSSPSPSDYGMLAAIFSVNKNVDIGLSYLQAGTTLYNAINGIGDNSNRSEIGVTWRF